jgi:hypothetical protein
VYISYFQHISLNHTPTSSNEITPSLTEPQNSDKPTDALRVQSSREAKRNPIYVFTVDIPTDITSANRSLHKDNWQQARQDEIASFNNMNTFKIVPSRPDYSLIGTRWVYTTKQHPTTNDTIFRARCIAQGYTQRFGVDYEETFAPVATHTSLKVLFSLAITHGWNISQIDFSTAYLNGNITQDIYIANPPGFQLAPPGSVLELCKSLCGLKQSGQVWNSTLHAELHKPGFKPHVNDECVYLKRHRVDVIILLLWVDGVAVFTNNPFLRESFDTSISSIFKTKDLGKIF